MAQASNARFLSVVVTVYTETYSVRETVDRLLASNGSELREILLVVAPKSSAETFKICEELEAQHPVVRVYVQQKNPGVGWAIREGMALAKEECVAIMSGDLETEPEAVGRMYAKMLETGADVVVGNRWSKEGGFTNYEPVKLVLNFCFQKLFRVIYWTKINDITYGFKILSKRVINSIAWESTRHEIFIETTVKPLHMGFYVEQVPTVWVSRTEGKSVNPFLHNFKYVVLALRVRAGRTALSSS